MKWCRCSVSLSPRARGATPTKRRKQIWEALNPVDPQVAQLAPPVEIKQRGHSQDQSFAAATAEATGQSKATTNRAIAAAKAGLGSGKTLEAERPLKFR